MNAPNRPNTMPKVEIFKKRFLLNMRRISGLVRVTLLDHEELKPSGILQSKGARADIFRSIVVFLHATFEDAVRSQIPRKKPNIPWNFYAKADLNKALEWAEIDASPSKPICAPDATGEKT
jgi:hypothetical protein